jgi:outer membrane protein OmpA-like peptidoglycan-associated protein
LPTESKALLNVLVTDFDEKPLAGETVIFRAEESEEEFSVITNDEGKAQILLPKGNTYDIKYKEFSTAVKYSKFQVPNQPGRFTLQLHMKYEPSKVFTLDNVYFDVDKATIKPESYKQLDELVELLKLKKSMEIEIAGHTDNTGSKQHNMELSQKRAEAVKRYLVKKGINPKRIKAQGYGDTQPIATNDTPEGRAKNRRIEVRILKEYKYEEQ